MSTGQRYVFSDGMEFKSQIETLIYLKNNPALRVRLSQVTMEGGKQTDVTEKFRAILADSRFGGAS